MPTRRPDQPYNFQHPYLARPNAKPLIEHQPYASVDLMDVLDRRHDSCDIEGDHYPHNLVSHHIFGAPIFGHCGGIITEPALAEYSAIGCCLEHGNQKVVGTYNQPQSFADPWSFPILACGALDTSGME